MALASSNRRVRIAQRGDAGGIAEVQLAAWRAGYAALLPPDVREIETAELAHRWLAAIATPPNPHHRVLVALDDDELVGFAAYGPAEDDDLDPSVAAELVALHVAPARTRAGHGSRLLAAVADHARDDGFAAVVSWIFAADKPLHVFLARGGFEPDGSTRELDAGTLLPQLRLHAALR